MTARVAVLAAAAAALAGCDWSLHRMIDQPRCEPNEATTLLPGGMCNLLPPADTVPYAPGAPAADGPIEVDAAALARGRDRFERFCAVCHGELADGVSQVAADMRLRPPPSLHEPRLVAASDERFFQVITEGYGLMPSYGALLAPPDRWAVIAWVRVLQRSQDVPIDALPRALREEALPWLR